MSNVPYLVTIPCTSCGSVFQIMEYKIGPDNDCHACKVRKGGVHNPTEKPKMEVERELVIREIQAFASDYAHEMTQDGVTREVLIVEQLIEFLKVPEGGKR